MNNNLKIALAHLKQDATAAQEEYIQIIENALLDDLEEVEVYHFKCEDKKIIRARIKAYQSRTTGDFYLSKDRGGNYPLDVILMYDPEDMHSEEDHYELFTYEESLTNYLDKLNQAFMNRNKSIARRIEFLEEKLTECRAKVIELNKENVEINAYPFFEKN